MSAKPGKPGYCGANSKNESLVFHYKFCSTFPSNNKKFYLKKENTLVRPNKYWGFCAKQCVVSDPLKNILQEAKLEIVPKVMQRHLIF